LLRVWQETGKTIVMVSHSIEEAALLSDRIAVMKQGGIIEIIEVKLKRPRNEETKEFLKLLAEIKGLLES
jgi:NitT/TauT family transport system ATP-binding protein